MAIMHLLGEQVTCKMKIGEKSAAVVKEIMDERDRQDRRWADLPADAPLDEIRLAAIAYDQQWSGDQWASMICARADKITPDMSDHANRRLFVKIAALALAALRT